MLRNIMESDGSAFPSWQPNSTGSAHDRFQADAHLGPIEVQSSPGVGPDGGTPTFQGAILPGQSGYGARPPGRHLDHGVATTIRTGVGSNPLQGLLIWGQFDTSTSVFISARSRTISPGAEMPSTIPRVPSSSTGTFM
jgi:hypothetical protein